VIALPETGAEEGEGLALDPGFAERFGRADRGPCRLYLVSPARIDAAFDEHLREALSGGDVAAFQLRLKALGDAEVLGTARRLIPICREHDVAFILNDRVDLAAACGADGVHLGQADGDPRDARAMLGPSVQIGVTCHDSRHLAMEAGEAGADYVAFGAFFPTETKQTSHRPDPSILGWWSTLFEIPCVAIGGITPSNAQPLVEAGADFLAVSSAVWNHPDGPAAAVGEFRATMQR
jgi:thiamine-phosphate pyrophosphorylase